MRREYHRWFSPGLRREMELLSFGERGEAVLVFPTRQGRFYDYENWGLVAALEPAIDVGRLRVYCVDSLDGEALYCTCRSPQARVARLVEYERYILDEVLPLIHSQQGHHALISHGCSLGAFHAVNIALRHPRCFRRVVALSGRYDLTRSVGGFRGLFDGHYDEDIYFQTPAHFIPNVQDALLLEELHQLQVLLAVGTADVFRESTEDLGRALREKGVSTRVDIWNGEAHRARDWREMVQRYFGASTAPSG